MKKLIIAAIAIVLVVGGVLVGIAIYNNQPNVVVRNALLNTIEDLGKRDEIAPVANMLEKGSLEFKAETDGDTFPLGGEDISASGKMYFSKDAFMLDGLKFKYGDEISLTGSAYVSEDLIYVQNKEILDGTYGVVRGEMAKAFKKSAIADEIPEEYIDLVMQILEDYDNGKDQDLKKDLEKYVEKYVKTAVLALEKNADYEAETDEVKINGEKVSARVIEVTIDGDTLAAIIEAVGEELESDKKLRKLVLDYADDYEDYLQEYGILEDDLDEMYDQLVEAVVDSADLVEDLLEEEIVIRVVTAKTSAKLMQLSVDYDKETLFTLDIGRAGIKKTNTISLNVADMVTVKYNIKTNTSKAYEAELTYQLDGEKKATTLGKISVDHKKETFKLTIPEADITASGKFSSKNGVTTITLNKITGAVEIKEGFKLTLVIDENDKMPKPASKVTNVFKITEEDIEEFADNAQEIFGGGVSSGKDEYYGK